MVRRRKIVQSMSELQTHLDIIKSLHILAQAQIPSKNFSLHRSNTFTSDGKGFLQIDVPITVGDLQKFVFTYGLDFLGNPIVLDSIGRVIKLDFSEMNIPSYNRQIKDTIHKEAENIIPTCEYSQQNCTHS